MSIIVIVLHILKQKIQDIKFKTYYINENLIIKNIMNQYNEYSKINLQYITYKTEELLELANNRYKITIQVANRAKRRKYEDIDIVDDPINKPIICAILEIVDEITQPEILSD